MSGLSKRTLFIIGLILFWSMISVLNLSQEYIYSNFKGWDYKVKERFFFFIGWILWALYTPIILRIVKSYPFHQLRLYQIITINIVFAILFSMGHGVIEVFISYYSWNLILTEPRVISQFLTPLVYKFHVNFFCYFFVAGGGYCFDYFRQNQALELEKDNLNRRLMESQLATLKLQIHPHFLFNTQHAINGLLRKGEIEKGIEMLTRLSDLLRNTLSSDQRHFVSLKEELGIVLNYLKIHQIRIGKRLQVLVSLPDELATAKIPNLLLQPLVENAVVHSISKYSDSGEIRITVIKKNNRLNITIIDDGVGVEKTITEGIGLANTRKRLTQLYPNNFRFDLQNGTPKGLVVTIEIPLENYPMN